jgi:exodeoxyribonuclease VII large subunit
MVDRSGDRLPGLLRARTGAARAELTRNAAELQALNPFATLERGYAIVRNPEGRVIVDSDQTSPGDQLEVRLATGALDVSVEAVRDSAS